MVFVGIVVPAGLSRKDAIEHNTSPNSSFIPCGPDHIPSDLFRQGVERFFDCFLSLFFIDSTVILCYLVK
jgi:hypothetical protein